MSGVIQIVPEIPPDLGGVADYAEHLKNHLAAHNLATLFLALARPGRPRRPGVIEFQASAGDFANTMFEALKSMGTANVLLHYVGYGFDPRGCPKWLIEGLEHCNARFRLTTIFHEVHLPGPPWTVRFWLGPKQKSLIRRL